MAKNSETTIKDIEHGTRDLVQKVETWFQKHFGHITPGTPDHAVATAAKDDLVATLQAPAVEPAAETTEA